MLDQIVKTVHEIADQTATAVFNLFTEKLRNFQPTYQLLYTEKEAAEFLKISVDTLQKWRKAGLIDYTEYPCLTRREDGHKANLKYVYKLENLMEVVDRFQVKQPASRKYQLANERFVVPVGECQGRVN
jgi:hypothetical protein